MDLICPYCDEPLNVNSKDGSRNKEDELHEMQCSACGKYFVFETFISYSYEAFKADCLNGSEHDYQLTHTVPRAASRIKCTMCEKERELTEKERKEFGIETKKEYFDKLTNK